MSPPRPSRICRSGSTASSCRSRHITIRWRQSCAFARSIRAISIRFTRRRGTACRRKRSATARRMRGRPVVADAPAIGGAMHPRCSDAGYVPERAPHRRRRPDVPLSAAMADRLARRDRRDGAADAAIARAANSAAARGRADGLQRSRSVATQPRSARSLLEDRHLEIVRAVVVLVVDEQHADELLADIDLGRVVLLRPRHHANLGVAEHALEIGVELPDFLNVHGGLHLIGGSQSF